MSAPIALPAAVYDTLEFVAMEFGGIEGEHISENYGFSLGCHMDRPLCPHAMLAYACDTHWGDMGCEPSAQLDDTGLHCLDARILAVKERIPFRQWCRRLNVVRGA